MPVQIMYYTTVAGKHKRKNFEKVDIETVHLIAI